jgi:N-terminal domain of anti-restriction factor ArdC
MPPRYRRPVGPAERARREQATADKLTALHERLAEQVAALRSGQDWRRWLDVARRLHGYSFNNTLLIAAQRPDATVVAGYEAWKALGRQVDKGERGLQILAPVVRRGRAGDDAGAAAAEPGGMDADPAERADTAPSGAASGTKEKGDRRGGGQVTGWRVAYVWDVSATSGEPLPTPPRPRLLAGQAPPGLWEALTRVVGERGFTVARGDCGAANGWTDYATRTVRVRADVDAAQAVKTMAHEAGHVLLHDPADFLPPGGAGIPRTATTPGTPTGAGATTAQCRGVREVEAESVAYSLMWTPRGCRKCRWSTGPCRREGAQEQLRRGDSGRAARRERRPGRSRVGVPALPDGPRLFPEHGDVVRLRLAAPVAVPRPARCGLGGLASGGDAGPAGVPALGAVADQGAAARVDERRWQWGAEVVPGHGEPDPHGGRCVLRLGDRRGAVRRTASDRAEAGPVVAAGQRSAPAVRGGGEPASGAAPHAGGAATDPIAQAAVRRAGSGAVRAAGVSARPGYLPTDAAGRAATGRGARSAPGGHRLRPAAGDRPGPRRPPARGSGEVPGRADGGPVRARGLGRGQ